MSYESDKARRAIADGSMTWDAWRLLPRHVREDAQSNGSLSPQLIGLEGCRVEVVDMDGDTRRFQVGKSTGWVPIHLELHNARSSGGGPADREYRSVRIVRGVR